MCMCTPDACRAVQLNKPIIPVRLEPGYEPEDNDWLGQLCRGREVFDLSNPQTFNEEWKRIDTTLRQLDLPRTSSLGGTFQTVPL